MKLTDKRLSTLISITSLLILANATAAFADDLFSQQWALNNTGQKACDGDGNCQLGTIGDDIKAAQAWKTSSDCSNVIVAVLDTGADLTHPGLKSNIIGGKNFTVHPATNDPTDDNLHGTHVTGTIAGNGANGGIAGICKKAKVLEVKVGTAQGQLADSDIIAGIKYASAQGARVVNGSFGGGGSSSIMSKTIQSASKTLFVFAAGNGNSLGIGFNIDKTPVYPASYKLPNIVVVAATDNQDKLGSFSNFGATTVALAAPGVGILSTMPTKPTAEMTQYGLSTNAGPLDGTSMATPHVTGAATLLVSQNPTWTPAQLKAKLIASVDKIASVKGKVSSGGRLNLAALLAK